jgi:hypothetical protein
MSNETRPADPVVGEGFAFFRWHSLMWPYQCTCNQSPGEYFCVRLWVNNDRRCNYAD